MTITVATVLAKFNAARNADLKLAVIELKLNAAEMSAESAFIDSAQTCYRAVYEFDISALSIEKAVKAKIETDGIKDRNFYSANSAIGFHALTGMALATLEGTLPVFDARIGRVYATPRDLQATIKVVGQTTSRKIISESADLPSAFLALLKAKDAKLKAKSVKVDETTDETTDAATDETTVAAMLASIENILSGAVKRDDWTGDDKAKAKTIAAVLSKMSVPAQFSSK